MSPTDAAVETGAAEEAKECSGILGTPIELPFLEEKLQEILETKARFGPQMTIERIGFGQGFLSVIFRVKFDWVGEDDGDLKRLPKSLVVKVPSLMTMAQLGKDTTITDKMKEHQPEMADFSKQLESMTDMLKMTHGAEVAFYKLVKEKKLNIQVPKCYYERDFGADGESGVLIFEDLADTASVKPIYDGIPLASLKALAENLATIHAYSLNNSSWTENPQLQVTFERMSKSMGGGEQFYQMLKTAISVLKTDHPQYFDPLIDRLSASIADGIDLDYVNHLHKELNIPPVLTHGDMWMNNLMWKKTEDGLGTTDQLAAIIDWQICHPGCIGEDFVRVLCSSVSPEVRREHLPELYEHYHTALRAALGREPPFTVAQMRAAYSRMFRFGVWMIVPAFFAFVQEGFHMIGTEDLEKRKHDVLTRCKCLIEDLYAIEDGEC